MPHPDIIVGMAVLNKNSKPEWLFFMCQRGNERYWPQHIPVEPKGTVPHDSQCWVYEVQGDTLIVTPSLRILQPDDGPHEKWKEKFHSEGRWAVRYVFKDEDKTSYDQLLELNP